MVDIVVPLFNDDDDGRVVEKKALPGRSDRVERLFVQADAVQPEAGAGNMDDRRAWFGSGVVFLSGYLEIQVRRKYKINLSY